MGFDNDWYPEPRQGDGPDWDNSPEWNEDPKWGCSDPAEEVELSFSILVHTTKEAYLLQFGERNVWVAKCLGKINMSMHNNTVVVPEWLMVENHLEEYSTHESMNPRKKTDIEKLFNRVVRKHIKELKKDMPFQYKKLTKFQK